MTRSTSHSRGATLLTLCVGASLLGGCAGTHKSAGPETSKSATPEHAVTPAPEAAPADQQAAGWATTPLGVRSDPVAVKTGTTPLVYLVESGGTFRVRDETAGQDIASSFAAARSIVRVDERHGVVFGRDTLLPGPLADDHRYAIYREPAGPNMMRQGTFQVRPGQSQAGARSQTQIQTQTQSGGSGSEERQEGGTDVQR